MRRALAIQTCVALQVAFCLAPFQHVHADHDHAAVVHTHFYASVYSHQASHGAQIDDPDDHASVQSLDNFTLAFAAGLTPFVLPRGRVLSPAFTKTIAPVETVDACGHDPPSFDRSIPRAPPA